MLRLELERKRINNENDENDTRSFRKGTEQLRDCKTARCRRRGPS